MQHLSNETVSKEIRTFLKLTTGRVIRPNDDILNQSSLDVLSN